MWEASQKACGSRLVLVSSPGTVAVGMGQARGGGKATVAGEGGCFKNREKLLLVGIFVCLFLIYFFANQTRN